MSSINSGSGSKIASMLARALVQAVEHGSSSASGSSSAAGSSTGASQRSHHSHGMSSSSGNSCSTGISSLTGAEGSPSTASQFGSSQGSQSSLSLPGSESGCDSSGSSGASGSSGVQNLLEELVHLLQPLLQGLSGQSGSTAGGSGSGGADPTSSMNSGGADPSTGMGGTTGTDPSTGAGGTTGAAGAGGTDGTDCSSGMTGTAGTGGAAQGPAGQYTGSGQVGAAGNEAGTQSGVQSQQALLPTQSLSGAPGPTDCTSASNVSSTQHDVHYSSYGPELAQNKQRVQAALDPMNASKSERSFLTAISLQESTKLNGNSDPNCFSIYNMNDKMIKDVTQKYGINVTPQELNDPKNTGVASQIALLALRDYGAQGFLAYERGGPTAYDQLKAGGGPVVANQGAAYMDSYYSTFQARFNAIQKDPSLLTDDRRPETSAG